jgi:hypothetical protein
MKRLLPLLLLLLPGACRQQVEVNVGGTFRQEAEGRNVAYGIDTLWVICRPFRDVTYSELRIDGVLVDVDTFPGPVSNTYEWDVIQLPESSLHVLQGKAISGSREYLSPDLQVWVGFRSRLLADGSGDSIWIYRPDGKRDAGFVPLADGDPICPRFGAGCRSIVFLSHHKLYRAESADGQAQLLDSVGNGIYSCDASPVSGQVAFEAYQFATAHLFVKDGTSPRVQVTHDGDIAYIDSSRFTCTANSGPVFSPDGSRLAYYRESKCLVPGDPHEGETRQDAFVVDRYGTNPVNLTPGVDNAHFSGFTWTFDGKWVLFREGTNATPDRVLAANLKGHAVEVTGLSPVAMSCSPSDSMLAYIGTELERHLHAARLSWTEDTLYVNGQGSILSDATLNLYLDWVAYSKR